ncbi:50S ribosomal protein L4 [Patescibacteria group bacterium]|nr:50S ribosomal protein L4 [Patescibacteria group bacterium]
MTNIPVYNLKGEKKKDIKLNPDIFAVEVKSVVLHRVVESILANRRQSLAATKDRSQVRGGGIKPWRQKGTGRARVGSNRSPLWKGGGVTFGPTAERNFIKKVNKKEKKKALLMALSDKAAGKKIAVIDEIKFKDIKTQNITAALAAIPSVKNQDALLVLAAKDNIITKSVANLPRVQVLPAANLNIYDVIRFEYLLLSLSALKEIEKTFAKE